jgi:hypothetical protein
MRQAWLQAETALLDRTVRIKLGRQFVPFWSSIPPPFGGTLDEPLTNKAITFFGDGLSASIDLLEGFTLSATCYKVLDSTGAPDRWTFAASYRFGQPLTFTGMAEIGPDPDRDWLAGMECTGTAGDFTYEMLGLAREFTDGRLMYGTHSYLAWQFTPGWTVHAQFDWLNTEARSGSDRILRQYRATGGIWYEPVRFLRLQVDGGHDWLRGTEHQNAWFITAGVTVKLP